MTLPRFVQTASARWAVSFINKAKWAEVTYSKHGDAFGEKKNNAQVGGCWIEKKRNRRTGKIGRSRVRVCEQLWVCVCLCVFSPKKSGEKLGLILALRCGSKLMCFFCHCKKKKKKSFQVTCGNVNPDMLADVKRGVVDKKNCSSGGITYQHIFRHPNHTWEWKLIKSLLLWVRKEDQLKAQFFPPRSEKHYQSAK